MKKNCVFGTLGKAAAIYVLTTGSAVILYAIHYTKPLNFKLFISLLITFQVVGLALMIDELYSEKKKIKELDGKLKKVNQDQGKQKNDALSKSCFAFVAVGVCVTQLMSNVGDTLLSILYFNADKVSTKAFVLGILTCCLIGCFVPLAFEYIGGIKGDLQTTLIAAQEQKLDEVSV